jgi:predicted nucleic acid-binding protein
MNQVLMDSSFLVALHNRRDVFHARAAAFARDTTRRRLLPVVILPETAYLLRKQGGLPAVSLLLKSVVSGQWPGITRTSYPA